MKLSLVSCNYESQQSLVHGRYFKYHSLGLFAKKIGMTSFLKSLQLDVLITKEIFLSLLIAYLVRLIVS